MTPQWDGVDRQIVVRLLIGICVLCLMVDRFTPRDDGTLFGMSIMFLVMGIFMVPEGPRPPDI